MLLVANLISYSPTTGFAIEKDKNLCRP